MVLIVTYFANKSTLHSYFDHTMIAREQAQQAALSGIQIAFSLLTPPAESKEESGGSSTQKSSQKSIDPHQHILTNVMPYLNRWQMFTLNKEIDGIDAVIKICLICEEGKLAFNKMFDFQKHVFVPPHNGIDPKKIMNLCANIVSGQGAKKNLDEAFEAFLKQRPYPFNDATEFVGMSALPFIYKINLFYAPPVQQTSSEYPSIFLTDLFTPWVDQLKMNPWLLSDSTCALFGLKRATLKSDVADRMQAAKLLKDLKKEMSLKERWDVVGQKLYGRDFSSISKDLVALLDESVRAKNFSVVSYGSVGHLTQRVIAIIAQNGADKFVIKKLYWI